MTFLRRSSRPHVSPTRLARWQVKRIRRLRKRRWTGRKIARRLSLPRSTVSLWLRRLSMGRLRDLEPKEKPLRYERSRPGELVHIDTKKLGRIGCVGHRIHGDRRRASRGVGWEFLHVCVDDATRLSYNEILSDERAVTVTAFTERAMAWFAALGVRGGTRDDGQRRRLRLASLRRQPGGAWGSGTSGPGRTGPRPTGRPSGSSRPPSGSGRTGGHITPPPSARPPSRPSSSVTKNDVITPRSETSRHSAGSRSACEQRP